MTDDLFAGVKETPMIDPNKDYLPELVGDGKKFKTPQELARGKMEADLFIETMKKQQDDLRAEYLKLREESSKQAKLDELIDRLQRQTPASSDTQTAKVDNTPPKVEFDESLIDRRIDAREAERKRQDNFTQVQNKLKERFGDNSSAVLKQQMDALDLTREDVNNLAYKSPKAFFKAMGLEEQAPASFQPPRSTRISENFNQKGNQKRTWSYYQELKKTNPQLYYDPKITNQMHEDYKSLGAAFQDGDFQSFGDGI